MEPGQQSSESGSVVREFTEQRGSRGTQSGLSRIPFLNPNSKRSQQERSRGRGEGHTLLPALHCRRGVGGERSPGRHRVPRAGRSPERFPGFPWRKLLLLPPPPPPPPQPGAAPPGAAAPARPLPLPEVTRDCV